MEEVIARWREELDARGIVIGDNAHISYLRRKQEAAMDQLRARAAYDAYVASLQSLPT